MFNSYRDGGEGQVGQNVVVFFISVQGLDLVCRWGSGTGGCSISDPALDMLMLI